MNTSQLIFFAPFHLDVSNEQLWKDGQVIPLRPKTLAVLQYLLEHPRRLITKEELLNTVWADTRVSKTLPKDYIQELRKTLNDDPKSPLFIETVHGRGYRFIGKVVSNQPSAVSSSLPPTQDSGFSTHHAVLVGREGETQQLHDWLTKAIQAQRQTVFVTGESGVGKTALVKEFLTQAARRDGMLIALGQCLEHYGVGEPYMPVLEALGRLCRDPKNAPLIDLLKLHAPTWLIQMSDVVSSEELELLQRRIQGVTRERMLREMSEAIEALTITHPLILVLEDLHWSDASTLTLLAALAQRTLPAKLFVIGTYRPAEVREKNPLFTTLTHELRMHKRCEELPLRFLRQPAITAYLTTRFPHHCFPAALSRTIHARTEGNPLFMINMVDYLVDQQLITKQGNKWLVQASDQEIENVIPESLQQIIEKHFEDYDPSHRRALEVASVAGVEFSAAAIASGLQEEEEIVEELCAALARNDSFIRFQEYQEWPDGSITGQYSFVHALYQEVLYNRITPTRRMRLHQRIGERKEVGYQDRCNDIAGELASHFERSRDYERAVRYLHLAGKNALQRCAYQEAIDHYTKALSFLKFWPETPERVRQELSLQMALGTPLQLTHGYAAPEVEQAYARAHDLCQQVGSPSQLFPIFWGLWVMYFVRGDLQTAQNFAHQLLQLAHSTQDPEFLLEARVALGLTSICLGEFLSALDHLQEGVKLYDAELHSNHTFVYSQDPGVVCLSWSSWTFWLLGYPDKALESSRDAVILARQLDSPINVAYALQFAAVCHQLRREGAQVLAYAEEIIALSEQQGFKLWATTSRACKGWALADSGQQDEGVKQIHETLVDWQAMGAAGFVRAYGLALLSEAYRELGKQDEGLAAVNGALALIDHSGEKLWEAELYWLKGELLLERARRHPAQSRVQIQSKSRNKAR